MVSKIEVALDRVVDRVGRGKATLDRVVDRVGRGEVISGQVRGY